MNFEKFPRALFFTEHLRENASEKKRKVLLLIDITVFVTKKEIFIYR